MITILEPGAKKTSAVVTVKHEGNVQAPVAVELKITSREIDMNGEVVHAEDKSSENFVLYPSQIILLPGDIQRVQIQWVGDSLPSRETAYGLIAQEAPIKLDDQNKERATPQGMVTVLTKYEAIVVLRPAGTRPDVVAESAKPETANGNETKLILVLHNKGTALQKLKGMKLQVTPLNSNGQMIVGRSISYKPELTADQTKHSLFAGYRRRFELPWPSGLSVGPVRVAVDFDNGN
jgi:fimbrial chaperone protein